MPPSSKTRSSFLQGLGKFWKSSSTAEPKTNLLKDHPRRFRELTVVDAEELAYAICCSRESMSPNRFQTVPGEDFDEISYRIHHLPNRLLIPSDSKRAARYDQSQACRLHRLLDYELMDDVLYVVTRTITKCAYGFQDRLEDAWDSQAPTSRAPLPIDITRTFATLEKANMLVRELCKCPIEDDDSVREGSRHRGKRSARSQDGKGSSYDRSEPCCPACHLSALSTNISFLIALRAFLLTYIPYRNHHTARRMAFLDGWVQHCSSTDRQKVREASQSIADQITQILHPRSPRRTAARVQEGTSTNAALRSRTNATRPPASSLPPNVAVSRPAAHTTPRTSRQAGSKLATVSSDSDSLSDFSTSGDEEEDELKKKVSRNNSSGFTDHVEEPAPPSDIRSIHSSKNNVPGRARRQLERQQIQHNVLLPDELSSRATGPPQPAPVPPIPLVTKPVEVVDTTDTEHRGFVVNDRALVHYPLPGSFQYGNDRLPASYRSRAQTSYVRPSRHEADPPRHQENAHSLPSSHHPDDPITRVSAHTGEPVIESLTPSSSNTSSKKHDSVTEPLSPPQRRYSSKRGKNDSNMQVYHDKAFQQSLDDVYRVLSSMESLPRNGGVPTNTSKPASN